MTVRLSGPTRPRQAPWRFFSVDLLYSEHALWKSWYKSALAAATRVFADQADLQFWNGAVRRSREGEGIPLPTSVQNTLAGHKDVAPLL